MAINRITFKYKQNNPDGTVETVSYNVIKSFKLASSPIDEPAEYDPSNDGALWIRRNVQTYGVSLVAGRSYRWTLLKKAYDELSQKRWISTINGIAPTTDGLFWLYTDACLNWCPGFGHIDRSTNQSWVYPPTYANDEPNYPQNHATWSLLPYKNVVNYIHPETGKKYKFTFYNREDVEGGLILDDSCPACESCQQMVDTAAMLARLGAWMNWLKDVNLFEQAQCATNLQLVLSHFLPDEENCSVPTIDTEDFPWSTRLLGQYATMVHMWNYVVSQSNASTQITVAPEDPSGISVQTKRAMPACEGATMKLTIDMEVVSGASDQMSTVIVKPHTAFKPFGDGSETDAFIEVEVVSAIHKRVIFNFGDIHGAGTYAAGVKMLPFVFTQLIDDEGAPVSLASAVYEPDEIPYTPPASSGASSAQSGLVKLKLGASKKTSVIDDPTIEQYNEGKTYPSHSVEGTMRWHITTKWELSGIFGVEYDAECAPGDPVVEEFEDEWYFETQKVREYIDGILRDSILVSSYNVVSAED